MKDIILVVNPGSTSTKVALFDETNLVAVDTIRHSIKELAPFDRIVDQKDFRTELTLNFMAEHDYAPTDLLAVVGRGGLLKPIPGGTYLVEEEMLTDLREEKYNTHASNLGAIIAKEIADSAGVQAYIVDPVVVDEMEAIAKISGLKGIHRRSVSHALNQKAVARRLLNEANKQYEESNVIVVHLGGGTSIGAHRKGKMVDVVNGLDGEGPFTPERTGQLPLYDFAKKLVEENLSLKQVKTLLAGKGGLASYLNEIDIRQIVKRIEDGDREAELYLKAMSYQIGKAVGEMAAVLKGQVDSIILTGGAAHSTYLVKEIQSYSDWIAPVAVYPGEREMEALYEGVMRVLSGEEQAKRYNEV